MFTGLEKMYLLWMMVHIFFLVSFTATFFLNSLLVDGNTICIVLYFNILSSFSSFSNLPIILMGTAICCMSLYFDSIFGLFITEQYDFILSRELSLCSTSFIFAPFLAQSFMVSLLFLSFLLYMMDVVYKSTYLLLAIIQYPANTMVEFSPLPLLFLNRT